MDLDVNIKSDTADKAIDLLDNSSKKSREALDFGLSRGINKLFDLIKSTPLGIKAEVYIQERPYKLQLAMESMKKKYEQIPEQNRIEPTSYIALKGINELNYSLDEEYLKEMFENLLVSDMDNRKQNKILPAYIEIIKQLSKNDAKLLKFLNDSHSSSEPIMKLKINFSNGGYSYPSNDIILISNEKTQLIPSIIIDNLSRLRIIETDFLVYKNEELIYENAFQRFKAQSPLEIFKDIPEQLDFSKGVLKITDFGKNFIDICLS